MVPLPAIVMAAITCSRTTTLSDRVRQPARTPERRSQAFPTAAHRTTILISASCVSLGIRERWRCAIVSKRIYFETKRRVLRCRLAVVLARAVYSCACAAHQGNDPLASPARPAGLARNRSPSPSTPEGRRSLSIPLATAKLPNRWAKSIAVWQIAALVKSSAQFLMNELCIFNSANGRPTKTGKRGVAGAEIIDGDGHPAGL